MLAQVQLSRVLGVKKGVNFHEWNNRINRMSYDFIVCGMDATVVAAIELDDKTHESADRAAAAEKKARASSAAGIRLVRWNVKDLPDEAAIRAAVAPRGCARTCSQVRGLSAVRRSAAFDRTDNPWPALAFGSALEPQSRLTRASTAGRFGP